MEDRNGAAIKSELEAHTLKILSGTSLETLRADASRFHEAIFTHELIESWHVRFQSAGRLRKQTLKACGSEL